MIGITSDVTQQGSLHAMRFRPVGLATLTSILVMTTAAEAAPPPPWEAAHCAAVKVSPPARHRGRTLVEIPDITEPELRLANQLMSAGCLAHAQAQLEQFLRQQPGSRNARYVAARYVWHISSAAEAENILREALAAYPEFTSATVLLAGIRVSEGRIDEGLKLIDQVEARAPTDLWIFMSRLRAEALRAPSPDLYAQLLEIVRDTTFPPNAREEAGQIAAELPGLTYDEHIAVSRQRLQIDSSIPGAYKAQDLAMLLSEGKAKYAETRALLESPRAARENYLGLPQNRVLLAQAYLMEAAQLGAGPVPANEHLIQRAADVLQGDFTGLAAHVMSRPQSKKLQPFLAELTHPEERDDADRIALCNAVIQLNVDAVEAQLEAGADPNARCDAQESMVGYVISMATTSYVERRQTVMRLLLEHGAKPVKLDMCRSPDTGDCADVLLPLLERYVR